MGINQLAPIIQILFPDAVEVFTVRKGAHYDFFMIDINGILYSLISRQESDDELILDVIKYIDRIVQDVQPSNTLFLALDGSAPLGKITTASNRRINYTSHKLRFTPGTQFMEKLKNALCLYAGRHLNASKFCKVIISGSDREGEGEYKIFEYLRNWRLHEPQLATEIPSPKCLVLGNDTDMLLFALLTSPELSVDLLRMDGAQNTVTKVITIREGIINGLKGDSERLVLDWCFLTILCGTDYNPRLGGYDYRKVYSIWRQFKSDPLNSKKFVIQNGLPSAGFDLPLTGSTLSFIPEPSPSSAIDSISSPHLGDSPLPYLSSVAASDLHKYEFRLNLQVFQEILKGSNFVELHFDHLSILSGHKVRDVNISPSDWKCNWNTLKQAFCQDLTFETKVQKINLGDISGGYLYLTQIYWTNTFGDKILAGEGRGVNSRTADYFACVAICMPSSSIMSDHIRHKMSEEDYNRLCQSLLAAKKMSIATLDSVEDKVHLKMPAAIPSSGRSVKQVYAFTKDSKVINDCDDACESLLKGAIWVLSMFQAKIINGSYSFPYNLAPSVDAMQLYLSKKISTKATQTQVPIQAEYYGHTCLPHLLYLFMLSKTSRGLLALIPPTAAQILSGTSSYPLEFATTAHPNILNHARQQLTTTEINVRLPEFQKELQEVASNLGLEVDAGLTSNNPSLLFMSTSLPHSTSEDFELSKCFERRNEDLLKSSQPFNFQNLGQSTSPLVKTWTGAKFRKVAAFSEGPASRTQNGSCFRPFKIPFTRSYHTSWSGLAWKGIGKRLLKR